MSEDNTPKINIITLEYGDNPQDFGIIPCNYEDFNVTISIDPIRYNTTEL